MSAEVFVVIRCNHCGQASGAPYPVVLPFRWGAVTAIRARLVALRGWLLKHPGDGTGPKDYCPKCVKTLGLKRSRRKAASDGSD